MPSDRKRRTRGHVIAERGVKHVEMIVVDAGFVTIPTPAGADYGIDLILLTFDAAGRVENGDVRVQVKAVSRMEPTTAGERFSIRVARSDVDYWLRETSPVILVCFDDSTGIAYWTYIQRYFARLGGHAQRRRSGGTISIRLNRSDVFDVEAVRMFASYKRSIIRQVDGIIRHD